MIDSRFYQCSQPLSLKELADISQSTLYQPLPSNITENTSFKDIATLKEATATDITLFHNTKYKTDFEGSKAGVCFIKETSIEFAPKNMALLISTSPQRSFALAANVLYPHSEGEMTSMSSPVHSSAYIGEGTILEYGVVIKANAKIGRHCRIGSYSVIGAGVEIGDHTRIGSHVTVSHALIGNNVTLFPGVRIGQAGFGFDRDERGFVTVPQLGRVIIEDDVEIGSNSTIDRGSLRDTIIGQGSRLDNLVMVAHNVVLGRGCILVAQAGIAGSTQLGKYVVVAGQAGIVGHLNIGDYSQIAAQSGVTRNMREREVVMGSPAFPIKTHLRHVATLNKISKTNTR